MDSAREQPPEHLSSTLKTGAAFKSTWRLPSMRPAVLDPGQSGVRRVDLPDVPPPNSGHTLHDLFSAPPPSSQPAASRVPAAEPSPRPRVTLSDMASAPPPGAPRGDWVAPVSVGPRNWGAPEAGRRDRITDPMGSTRLRPEDLQPRPGAASSHEARRADAPARRAPHDTPGAEAATPAAATPARAAARRHDAPRLDPPRPEPSTPRGGDGRAAPWGLMVLALGLSAGLVALAVWLRDEAPLEPGVNVVLPLVQAPAETEPMRTSVKVTARKALEATPEGETAIAAEPRHDQDPQALPQTWLESSPQGAEVVLRGAVIANTPTLVTLPGYETEYLVRKAGYVPELIRIDPGSPERIQIELKPASE